MRVNYRVRQFWLALTTSPDSEDITIARDVLSPTQYSLFSRMQPSEQAHSLWIAYRLVDQGLAQRDLLVAALLHDVGKSRYPLHPWERALIVLGLELLPGSTRRWGQGEPRGWRKPFVVGQQHPAWGAEMVLHAGGTPLAANLIRRHHVPVKPTTQEMVARGSASYEDYLLFRLQSLDNVR